MTERTKDTHTSRRPRFKDYLPKSLFGRTMMIIIMPLILLQLTATVVFFDRHWIKMTERLADAVAGELATICQIIEDSNADPYIIEGLSNVIAAHQEIIIDFAPDAQLQETFSSGIDMGLRANFAKALERKIDRPFNIKVSFATKQIDVWIQLEQGVLHAHMPERRLFSSSGYIFILWLIGLSIVFFAISVWLMRNQIRPIHRLASAANRLGKGQDVSFFKPTGAREVRQAAESFLKMRDRIRRQIEQRTAMLAGVSHDLRTPITRLKLQAAMMADLPPNAEDIKAMQDDLHEMENMIDAYLSFAKGLDTEDNSLIDLTAFTRDIARRFESADKTITVTGNDESIDISLRRNQMSRAFTNIISNALKYGDNLDITIKRYKEDKEVTVTFVDNGPGIPDDELERVFRPFYRVESSRSKKTGGVGLGLSITQDIINGHGGHITLEKAGHAGKIKGLKVIVTLPL